MKLGTRIEEKIKAVNLVRIVQNSATKWNLEYTFRDVINRISTEHGARRYDVYCVFLAYAAIAYGPVDEEYIAKMIDHAERLFADQERVIMEAV